MAGRDPGARQEAARELAAPRAAFRERLATLGGVLPRDDRRDITPVLAWAAATGPSPGQLLRACAWALPALAIGALALGPALGLPTGPPRRTWR